MQKRNRFHFLIIFISIGIILAGIPRFVMANEPDAADLQKVWEKVRESGAYHFSADLNQAVGSQSENEGARVHLEGEADLTADSLELTLWKGGGSVLLPETGTQIKVADGVAYARQGTGEWEPIDDFSGLFAPGGDFLAYLSAADNVVSYAPEIKTTPLGE
ncbi:MAG: hypothetical protein WAM60_23085, partial [Candidatus Promineifilaceae bacterium]